MTTHTKADLMVFALAYRGLPPNVRLRARRRPPVLSLHILYQPAHPSANRRCLVHRYHGAPPCGIGICWQCRYWRGLLFIRGGTVRRVLYTHFSPFLGRPAFHPRTIPSRTIRAYHTQHIFRAPNPCVTRNFGRVSQWGWSLLFG